MQQRQGPRCSRVALSCFSSHPPHQQPSTIQQLIRQTPNPVSVMQHLNPRRRSYRRHHRGSTPRMRPRGNRSRAESPQRRVQGIHHLAGAAYVRRGLVLERTAGDGADFWGQLIGIPRLPSALPTAGPNGAPRRDGVALPYPWRSMPVLQRCVVTPSPCGLWRAGRPT